MELLRGINHITIAVSDLSRSFEFYTERLGMTPHVKWESGAYLTLGETWFCLSCDDAKPCCDYTHVALDIRRQDFDGFARDLRATNVVEWKQNNSEGQSLYFLDPDGHKLEIHSGGLQDRLESLESTPYKGMEWF